MLPCTRLQFSGQLNVALSSVQDLVVTSLSSFVFKEFLPVQNIIVGTSISEFSLLTGFAKIVDVTRYLAC